MFAQLLTDGFLFTNTALPVALMKADYGSGYAPPAAVIGSPHGLRGWSIRINVLPDDESQASKVSGETRAVYLWEFWRARKREGDVAFWVKDPNDGRFYLAGFVDDELSLDLLCAKAFATGLQLRQRRDREQASPVVVLPGTPAPPDWPIFGETDFGG